MLIQAVTGHLTWNKRLSIQFSQLSRDNRTLTNLQTVNIEKPNHLTILSQNDSC